MDIEDLSKSQLLLLTILVNFVTAIATAVLTVSLLDETSPTITQTVNRIVDHTIETVTQGPSGSDADPTKTTEDLLVASIGIVKENAVSFHRDEPTDGVIGVGTYIPSLRLVVTANTDAIGTNLPRTLTVVFADKSSQRATLLKSNASTHLYTFEAGLPLPGGANSALATAEDIKQGQTVIALDGGGSVVTGIVSKIENGIVRSNLPSVPSGSGIVNLSGRTVGIMDTSGTFIVSAETISTLINSNEN